MMMWSSPVVLVPAFFLEAAAAAFLVDLSLLMVVGGSVSSVVIVIVIRIGVGIGVVVVVVIVLLCVFERRQDEG